jgi:hypothetical protein
VIGGLLKYVTARTREHETLVANALAVLIDYAEHLLWPGERRHVVIAA